MINKIISGCLLMVGIIHMLPILGVVGVGQLEQLYGIEVNEPNLEILMRHRAVLFGLLGGFIVAAAFKPQLQVAAVTMGLISVTAFIALAWSVGDANAALQKVVLVDWVALAVLIMALFLILRKSTYQGADVTHRLK